MAELTRTERPWGERIRSRAGWSDASAYTISDLTMLRKELVIGFVVAGFASVAVPTSVWRGLFLTGHGFWSSLENVIVGPFLAFVSFVCSIGNVPLAAALWKGGIGFGGAIAFVFADLLALPLVLIYRKYYGTRLALRLSLVFWAVMSVAGLITEGIFAALGSIPVARVGDIATVHIGLNYTTVLNVIALIAFAYLYYLYRNEARLGGGEGYAKDPICGMQVRTGDAPARTVYEGVTYHFCSDHCLFRFNSARSKDAAGQAGAPPDDSTADGAVAIDPVCGMEVRTQSAAAHQLSDGQDVLFCSTSCRDRFAAEPSAFSGGPR